MAFIGDHYWYIDYGDGSTTGYYAVTQWAAATVKAAGDLIRPATAFGITSGNERIYACISSTGGTGQTGGASPPFNGGAVIARGAKNTDNTVVWQECTGLPAMNGDTTNAPTWLTVKNQAVSLGQVILNNAKTKTLICTTAGTTGNGSEPAFAAYTAAGATTADNTATWTTLKDSLYANWSTPFPREFIPQVTGSGWAQAGHVFFVASSHQDITSLFTGSAVGTVTLPLYVVCVGKSNVPPTAADVTTGAIIGGGSGVLVIGQQTQGVTYYKNIKFQNVGNSQMQFKNGINSHCIFDTCTFDKSGDANASGSILFNAGGSATLGDYDFVNCIFKFGHIGQSINGTAGGNGYIRIRGGSIALTGTVPTNVFTGNLNLCLVEGVDLSAVNTTLVAAGNSSKIVIKDCKLNASVTKTGAQTATAAQVDIVRAHDSNNYNQERHTATGDLTIETTIVRTGGASDGVQPISWKIITNSSANWLLPFEAPPIWFRNTIVGSPLTVTIYGIWGGGAVPNNDDIWMDVEYLGDSGSPLGTILSGTKADFMAAGTAQSSDGSTWGGSTTKFKMTATITPQKVGLIFIYVKYAKLSTTFYIDPKHG